MHFDVAVDPEFDKNDPETFWTDRIFPIWKWTEPDHTRFTTRLGLEAVALNVTEVAPSHPMPFKIRPADRAVQVRLLVRRIGEEEKFRQVWRETVTSVHSREPWDHTHDAVLQQLVDGIRQRLPTYLAEVLL